MSVPDKNRYLDKVSFVERHKPLCRLLVLVGTWKQQGVKFHRTDNGKLLISLARTELGYSEKTFGKDITIWIWRVAKDVLKT